ncbi:small acid-soluble spore protein SspI [Laceyella sacchari]|jgi:small acid-soluble spore protein I (minor)|uniref:Small, acid-soluble spore protein I n=3 Tax=Laceyella TaxID=292635 RepID=A0AA46ADD9_9BACL|nr:MULTISPECIES: small acid-soluble spore protein SspI [Laceyella]KPC73765.1 small acid-soluble spore protein SspI [Thermoactinomyces vulgaris]AUS08262.1 small acid-soluble spore protein SspI [Laceyella sacchari]MRG26876.1 small acid-soluble spore protein SspI [Laceyella tengchongensis]PRZ16016.1 small acid-soluble spore protein I (minor) [Laceyella sediminis]TCW40898.1 small acid-soluble spore protein I (minor) [Laceyella sacchari]
MNFDIRGAVIHNIHTMNPQQLQELVVDSIQQGEEKLLPGLGVLFEVIWKNSSDAERNQLIETLHEALPK